MTMPEHHPTQFDGVFFDLDGTLLDTLADLATAANRILDKMGLPVHDTEAYRFFVGNGARKLAERILPDGMRDRKTIERAVTAFKKEYALTWNATSRPYPGIMAMLRDLSRRGTTMAILSNKPDDFTRLCVAELLPGIPFAAVRGVLPGGPLKPDPAGALALSRKLLLQPKRILYVGDTSMDMETARSAGMFAVGVLWGFRTRKELEQSGAHRIIETPGQILDLLEGTGVQRSSDASHSA